jgi:RimK family alpha-L-glutamate ligase
MDTHVERRIAIVASRPSETNLELVREWVAFGVAAEMLAPDAACEVLGPGDVAVGRIDVRSTLDGVEDGLAALAVLRRRGVSVLNGPAASLAAHDKLRTAAALAAWGVAHPRTVHLLEGQAVELELPVVLKPRFGSWGADVIRCDSEAELRSALADLADRQWFRRQGVLAQELIEPVGYDLRVLVAGGQVVGGESRIAKAGEWRTNISLGGLHCPALLPRRARTAALVAAHAVRGDFVGVDLLPRGSDYVVIEVNGCVDFDGGHSLPGRSVFADIATALGFREPGDDPSRLGAEHSSGDGFARVTS